MVAAQAVPAWAGGVGGVLSPVFGQSCAIREAAVDAGPGPADSPGGDAGNVAQVPFIAPYSQCGDGVSPVGALDGGVG
ncbi:chaplin family protein [Streptomyces sp. NPDC059785]|uniref:chaplin family protein n=1 Tax=unclassified Streptomyces TaxID=2593676 RepID=UPI0036527B02